MISIIVPFNDIKYLEKCLNNLTHINYKSFEIVLIHDFPNSNDQTDAKNVVNKYSNLVKIRYYKTTEETLGVGNARNVGIQKAKGKYIMFVDVDDTINQNLLNRIQQFIDQDIDIIKYKIKLVYKNRVKKIPKRQTDFGLTTGENGFNILCFKDAFLDSPCLYIIKKKLFKEAELNFSKNVYHEDFEIIPQLIVNAKTIVATSIYGYYYFQSDDSIIRNNDYAKTTKKVGDKFLHYNNMKRNLEKYNISNLTKKNLLAYYTNSILISIKNLKSNDKEIFKDKIRHEKMLDNLKSTNLKQAIKKTILKLLINR